MADSAQSSDPLERYGAIERAYCEERWMVVIQNGQALLAEFDRDEETPPDGLRERLQLLVGHAFLYGIGDRDSAEDLYQAVLRSDAESSLRQIAEQGLQQCALPLAPAEAESDGRERQWMSADDEPQDSPAAFASRAVGDGASPSESIVMAAPAESAVAPQAAPDSSAPPSAQSSALQTPSVQASSVQISSIQSSSALASSVQAGPPSWLTTPAAAAPRQPASQPVMPWLQSDAPAAASPLSPAQISDTPEPVAGEGDQEPEDGPLSPPSRAFPGSLSGDPDARQSSSPLNGAAGAEAFSDEPSEAFQWPAAEPQSDSESASADTALALLPEDPVVVPVSLQVAPGHDEPETAVVPGPVAGEPEQRLVADVVEEPELIEVQLAAGQAGEELLLHVDDHQPGSLPEVLEVELAIAAPVEPDPQLAPPGPAVSPAAVVMAAPGRPAASGPFSAPPEPVAEEDPELLMGLLKLEMG